MAGQMRLHHLICGRPPCLASRNGSQPPLHTSALQPGWLSHLNFKLTPASSKVRLSLGLDGLDSEAMLLEADAGSGSRRTCTSTRPPTCHGASPQPGTTGAHPPACCGVHICPAHPPTDRCTRLLCVSKGCGTHA